MFKVHIQNKLLKRMPVTGTGAGLRWYLCPGQEKERGKGGGGRCLQLQYKREQAVRQKVKGSHVMILEFSCLAARDLLYVPQTG